MVSTSCSLMLRIRIFWGLCWILWTSSRWGLSCVPHVGKPYFAHSQSRLHHYCRGKPYVFFWNALNIEAEHEEYLWNVSSSLTELLLFLFWCFEMTVILQSFQSHEYSQKYDCFQTDFLDNPHTTCDLYFKFLGLR